MLVSIAGGVADAQHRHLAERRNRLEPVGLGREVDIDPLERHALFGKRDGRALDIGAKMVADQGERGLHLTLPRHS